MSESAYFERKKLCNASLFSLFLINKIPSLNSSTYGASTKLRSAPVLHRLTSLYTLRNK